MTSIVIPADRAKNHGGDEFYSGGAKFAETFDLWGDLGPGQRVLDIGCGPGRMAIGIGERYGWSTPLIGFDVIAEDVAVCQAAISSAHANFQFHHIDAWNGQYNPAGVIKPYEVTFPVADESIDFAFATSVFTHMFRREVERYVGEVKRVLRPGGVFLTSWFALPDEALAAARAGRARFAFPHVADDGVLYEKADHPEDVVGYRLADIQTLLAGFEDVAFRKGAWSRTPLPEPARHSQDITVARKAR